MKHIEHVSKTSECTNVSPILTPTCRVFIKTVFMAGVNSGSRSKASLDKLLSFSQIYPKGKQTVQTERPKREESKAFT